MDHLTRIPLTSSILLFQAAIAELPWNWAALLQSDLGLTEAAFRSLLFHRHEMQDGAYLEETEMKPVQILRNKFDAE